MKNQENKAHTFKEKFELRRGSYTADHVKEQLQRAYTRGTEDLYEALKLRFTKECMFEACAILRNHKTD